jgi:transposase
MEEVLDVYHRPYDPKRPQVCMDEKSKELHSEIRAPVPCRPAAEGKRATPKRTDSEYKRNGTVNLFIWFEPLTGRRQISVTDRRTKADWAREVQRLVEVDYADAERVVLVMDNLNTHTIGSLYEEFPPEQAHRIASRLEIHYTPKHGSWLNMAEIELSVLGRQCLNRRIPDKDTLTQEVDAWVAERNAKGMKMEWRFTTADARIKLKHLYPTLQS